MDSNARLTGEVEWNVSGERFLWRCEAVPIAAAAPGSIIPRLWNSKSKQLSRLYDKAAVSAPRPYPASCPLARRHLQFGIAQSLWRSCYLFGVLGKVMRELVERRGAVTSSFDN